MVWILALEPFGCYGSNLGGLWRFLALGSLTYLLSRSSRSARALARWLSGSGAGSGGSLSALAIFALWRSQSGAILGNGGSLLKQVSRGVVYPPFRKKSKLAKWCQFKFFRCDTCFYKYF